jgi:glutathione S-transferase
VKLHFNPASPFVRMVRVTAHEVGVADQIELVPTGGVSPVEVHARVAADNPLGKIPCLVTDHGHSLFDARVICEYLAHHAGRTDLFPHEPVKRFRSLTVQALAHGIADAGRALPLRNRDAARGAAAGTPLPSASSSASTMRSTGSRPTGPAISTR